MASSTVRRGQVGRSTTLQQKLDHPPPAPGLLLPISFASLPAANGRGQRRLVEVEAPGVDIGAGVQQHGRDGNHGNRRKKNRGPLSSSSVKSELLTRTWYCFVLPAASVRVKRPASSV